jgi:Spx/MgsR family transcriptional regulator
MYGIPNCDTVKKARTFLEKKDIAYEFIDFKKSPPSAEDLERWKKAFGDWPLNKKGPTFRKNAEAYELLTPAKIPAFIIANSSMIKRPILEKNGKVIAFGFDEASYQAVK